MMTERRGHKLWHLEAKLEQIELEYLVYTIIIRF